MKSKGVENIIFFWLKSYVLISILSFGVLFSQDAPEEFDFNISIYQSFYFFINSDIDGEPLVEGEDWIASFNKYDETMDGQCEYIGQDIDDNPFTDDCRDANGDGVLSSSVDVCVGSFAWSGEYTTVPVMGDDGTQWTVGYMQNEQLPTFKIYDASEDAIYNAVPSVVYPWSTDLAFYVINISVFRDCNQELGGEAFIDDCDECIGGSTGLEENYLDVGCGCNELYLGPFYGDIDGDGLGYGDEQYFCDNPGLGWSENSNDPYPDCTFNFFDCNDSCGGTALIDDCGVCSSGDTGLAPNADLDCNNECFGFAYYDDCDQCVGGSTGLEACDFQSDQPEEFTFYQSTLQAFYYIVNASFNNGASLSTQDWIGVFKNDTCVGSIKWDGPFTTLPAMGDDGSQWTDGYLNIGDFPTFKLYDASVNEFYEIDYGNIIEVVGSDEIPYTGWGINDFYYVYDFMVLSPDCNGIIGGLAMIDDCGVCSGGSTGIDPNSDLDCAGVCFGEADLDNCGVCSGGTSDNIPNADDLGCGCFLNPPQEYYADVDNDGFGYGDPQLFCSNPGDGWSSSSNDPEPFCYNIDIESLNIDDCGICNGGNENLDCSGICFGIAELDDCGVCEGDNSTCQSPIVINLAFSTLEDEELIITLSGIDPNDSELSFIITESPLHGDLVGNPDNLSEFIYTPIQNFNGEDSFGFMAFNGFFYSDEAIATIDISAVNDAPLANDIITELDEDNSIGIFLSGDDVDGDELTFSIISLPSNGSASITDGVLLYTPSLNYSGNDIIEYVSNDGELQSELAIISISIVEINDAPIAEDVLITLYEDNLYTFEFSVFDVDNTDEQLSVWILDELDFGVLTVSGLEGNILPSQDVNGEFAIGYRALDGSLFSEDALLTIEILPVNDPPSISSILNQSINEDESFNYFLNAVDVDSEILDFFVDDIDNATAIIDGQTLLVTPNQDYNGSLVINVHVSDGEYSDSEQFILDVLPVNDAPEINDIASQTSLEDTSFILEINADDVDGDNLTYWSTISDNGEVIMLDNSLTITPDQDWFGEMVVTVNVTDGEYSDSQDFTLDILPVNDPPVILQIDNQSINEDSSFSYNVSASDIDGDEIIYSASEVSNASIEFNGSELLVTPDSDFFGILNMNITISDDEYSDSSSFELEVAPVNDPPVLEPILDQEISENGVSEISFSVFDVDNENLSYDYYISSGYAYGSISDDLITITPSPNWSGEILVDFIVSDGEYYVQDQFMVIVIEIDDPPIAYDVSSTSSEDESISIDLIASDPDSDPEVLVYSITSEPSYGDVSINGSYIDYTPNSNYNGNDQLSYSVFDGTSESNIANIDINIIPVNDSPTAIDIEYSVNSDSFEFDLSEAIDDIDGDELEVTFITQNYGSESVATLFNGTIQPLGNNIFSYIPPEGMVFFDMILYKAEDELSQSTIQTITFNLFGREIPRNMAPIAFDQDVNIVEDEIVDVTLIGFDVLNEISSEASFEILSNPSHGDLSLEYSLLESGSSNLVQWAIEYTPDANYFGQDSFTYRVINPDNSISESEAGTIYININAQNDAPLIYLAIPDQTLTEDSNGNQLSLDLFFIDVDNDELTYDVLSTNDDVVNVEVLENSLSIIPLPDQWSGPFSVSITASDGELEITQSFTIEVLSVNDPPSATASEQILDEDNSISIFLTGSDPEFDPLSYLIYTSPSNGSATINGNVVVYQPNNDFNGEDSFGFRTFDGQYNSDIAIVSLTINPVNDAPILSDVSNQSVNEDETFEFTLTAEDVDGDELSYSINIIDEVDSYSIDNNIITVTPTANMNGEIEINTTVFDDELTDNASFILTVIAQPDPPELTQISNQSVNEDESFAIILNAIDIDGDDLSYYASSDINEASISVEGNLLIINSPLNFYGAMTISYGVTDGIYNIDQNFLIDYIPQPDPPVISEILNQEVLESEILDINVIVSDPDQDDITLSVIISDDISYTINDSQISFQGQDNISGDYEVIVIATDGLYSDEESFILTVINVNDPPVSYSDSFIFNEDNSQVILLSADDPDFDELTFHLETSPEFGTIDIVNGVATYNPNLNYFGEDSFTFYASDAEVISNISTISLEILPINDAPIITSDPILDAIEDELYSYQIIAIDPENDSLAYELDSFPEGMEINDSGLITWIPIEGQLASGEIIVTVQDGGEDGTLPFTQTFTIEVEPVNDRPEIISTPTTIAYEDELYSYQVEVSDPDSDVFYFNLLIGPEGLTISNEGFLTWTPTEGITSSGTVALVVWDIENPDPLIDLPAIQEFIITVEPVNDPPIIISTPSSNGMEDVEYVYQVEVEDIDNDVFYFSLLESPVGMEINQYTGLLTWTPGEGILSSGNISIQASDGENEDALYAIQNFAISITAVNDPPIIISSAPTSGVQNEEYIYEIVIDDPDDDEFIYLLFDAPQGMEIDYNTGILTWTPQSGGVFGPITLRVQDGGEDYASPATEIFSINVQYASGPTTLVIPLHSEYNLISYSAIPENNSINSVLFDLNNEVTSIITEGLASVLLADGWYGSLIDIQPSNGYWLRAPNEEDMLSDTLYHIIEEAIPTPQEYEYIIHPDYNLISYVGVDGVSVTDALPNNFEENIVSIVAEGAAAIQLSDGWYGSLDAFYRNKGYWLRNQLDDSLSFSWEIPNQEILLSNSMTKREKVVQVPQELLFKQSSKQAFYFIEKLKLDNISLSMDDWIVAYNNNVIVGARKWNGKYTDIPAMGYDGTAMTGGYCNDGDIPTFKIFISKTGEIIDLDPVGNILPWEDLGIDIISQLNESIPIPKHFDFSYPYPNPFNPSTIIEFGLPNNSNVKIIAYDIMGRHVDTILHENLDAGYHNIHWKPSYLPTGIYFLNIQTDKSDLTHKVMYIK